MAVDLAAVVVRVDLGQSAGTASGMGAELTAIVVYDGHAWLSLCREYGIASEGDTREEALANLLDAVREATNFAAEKAIPPGRVVPDDEVRSFMLTHRPGAGSTSRAVSPLVGQRPTAVRGGPNAQIRRVLGWAGFTLERRGGNHDIYYKEGHPKHIRPIITITRNPADHLTGVCALSGGG